MRSIRQRETKPGFGGVSAAARAIDLPHEGFGSYFLDVFDRPRRVTGCECERSSGATLAQVLLLANSGRDREQDSCRQTAASRLCLLPRNRRRK